MQKSYIHICVFSTIQTIIKNLCLISYKTLYSKPKNANMNYFALKSLTFRLFLSIMLKYVFRTLTYGGKTLNKNIISELLDTEKTISADIFNGKTYPHEVLPEISSFILKLGNMLPGDSFYSPSAGIWIAKSANVAESAYIGAPCIIDENAEIRHCAFIRGSAIVGKGAVVGNSTELKNVILFDGVQVPHYNYVGDSVLGYKSHMGAASITSNVKSDKTNVKISYGSEILQTKSKKIGAILGDCVEVGCGSVLNPGTVVGKNTSIYPLSSVRGYVKANSIYKKAGEISDKF